MINFLNLKLIICSPNDRNINKTHEYLINKQSTLKLFLYNIMQNVDTQMRRIKNRTSTFITLK